MTEWHPRTSAEALAFAESFLTFHRGLSLKFVRTAFAVPAKHSSARQAWEHSETHFYDEHPPRGVPVFYENGPYGHITISGGDGRVLSTDHPVPGHVGWADQNDPKLGEYLGWSKHLNGVQVYFDLQDQIRILEEDCDIKKD